MAKVLLGLLLGVFFSCAPSHPMEAPELIEKTILAHGWQLKPSQIRFDFRDYHYEVNRGALGIQYSREKQDSLGATKDIWTNFSTFERTLNGLPVALSDSLQTVYANSLNSVLYFVQLPLGLQDQAVLAEYKGVVVIESENYHQLAVTFKQEGGGEDYQDQFYYWIHSDRFEIDYLAYSYHTNGGGTRFRKAISKNRVGGILFQDFDNYKPPVHPTPLDRLPLLFQEGKLQWLSKIENLTIRISPTRYF